MFLQPINLGWHRPRADFMVAYGVYLPTGRYEDGADNNTGLGMWAQEVLLGTTVFLNDTRTLHAATTATFDFQSEKKDSSTKVGNILNLEGGVGADLLGGGLTAGLAYYGTYKLSDDRFDSQPMYFQLAFALDRIRALAPGHAEWKVRQPFKDALEGDLKGVLAGGDHSVLQIIAASHSGNTTEEFEQIVTEWIGSARHPVTKRAYVEMVYQPMLEVLTYLRANGYKTFIVSGGGVEFMRPWSSASTAFPQSRSSAAASK